MLPLLLVLKNYAQIDDATRDGGGMDYFIHVIMPDCNRTCPELAIIGKLHKNMLDHMTAR